MKKFHQVIFVTIGILSLLLSGVYAQKAEVIKFPTAKVKTGDDNLWKDPLMDDSDWKTVKTSLCFEKQGFANYDGYIWYRIHFFMPALLLNNAVDKDRIILNLGLIDDVDATYLNGVFVGKTGTFPDDTQGYNSGYNSLCYEDRSYFASVKKTNLKLDGDNVIAIRVYDGRNDGGMLGSIPELAVMDMSHALGLTCTISNNTIDVRISNKTVNELDLKLDLKEERENLNFKTTISSENIKIVPANSVLKTFPFSKADKTTFTLTCTELKSGKYTVKYIIPPYILTPLPLKMPRVNGAKIFGVRPNSVFLYRIPATGQKPLRYEVSNLPEGLAIDSKTGIITGKLTQEGNFNCTFTVSNALGTAQKDFTIKVGNLILLTPPMGWSSWNGWGEKASQEILYKTAKSMIDKGIADHGWSYINVDDAWEAEKRAEDGTIVPNSKFPDIKGLIEQIHSLGLKFGLYSSPGVQTCANYMGSYKHEWQDAKTYADWGVDYLKHDWCTYGIVFAEEKDTSVNGYLKPYKVMGDALRAQNRDIIYSLCQYGMGNVWEWGEKADANSWRTTHDMVDTWKSVSTIGFSQEIPAKYTKPGRWNDADMMVIGNLGGGKLRPTNLTADEQYSHFSLWSLLSSPLLLGCDLIDPDDFLLNLITNDEVLAVNQDILGKPTFKSIDAGDYQVWTKELENGARAVGIFNITDDIKVIKLSDPIFTGNIRDLWRQKDLGTFSGHFSTTLNPHGVTLVLIDTRL